LHKQARHLSAS